MTKTAITLSVLSFVLGMLWNNITWIDRAIQAEHAAKRTKALELQVAYLEGVFIACLNDEHFFVQTAIYRCTSRKTELTKKDI